MRKHFRHAHSGIKHRHIGAGAVARMLAYCNGIGVPAHLLHKLAVKLRHCIDMLIKALALTQTALTVRNGKQPAL